MAIVKMSHFNALVFNEDLDQILHSLQRFSNVSFTDQSKLEDNVFDSYISSYDFESSEHLLEHIKIALKTLKDSKPKRGDMIKNLSSQTMTYDALQEHVENSDLNHLLDMYSKSYASIHTEIGNFKLSIPWEEASLSIEELESYHSYNLMIGTVDPINKEQFESELKKLHKPYVMRNGNKDRVSYVIIPQLRDCSDVAILFDKYDFEKRSDISMNIESEVQEFISIHEHYLDKRSDLASQEAYSDHYQKELEMHYEVIMNAILLEETKKFFTQSESMTYMSGWIQTEDVEKLESLIVSDEAVYLEIEDADKDSRDVPIVLKNNKLISAFEPITSMYALPTYNELDPTPILAPFYALFFGMMLADLGYGIIMFVVMSVALRIINFKPGMEKMIRLLKYLGVTTALWGFIYGSFFGGIIPMKAIIDISTDFNFVLVLAIILGLFHLFLGLGVKGYIFFRDGKKRYIIYDVLFWYMTLSGLVIIISQMFSPILEPYTKIGQILAIVGMIGIVLTNGREAKSIPGKAVSGLYSLYGLTNYIGDVVSYSRLMALGLAGASIGMAFNMMVEMVSGFGIFGVLAGVVIFMIGHTFNLLINGMSSYVHAARLTYVEFFGKFYTGGGRPFKAFRAKPTYIIIKEEK